jgi:hypothetical protein
VDNLGFVAAGYMLTVVLLAGYLGSLRRRIRRASDRAAQLSQREG